MNTEDHKNQSNEETKRYFSSTIIEGYQEFLNGKTEVVKEDDLSFFLDRCFDEQINSLEDYRLALQEKKEIERRNRQRSRNLMHMGFITVPKTKPWKIEFAEKYLKTLPKLDPKMKGKILDAFSTLSTDPVTPVGNTVKRLTGDKKGMWRYRIEDYRLVYIPKDPPKSVTVIDFKHRKEVYR